MAQGDAARDWCERQVALVEGHRHATKADEIRDHMVARSDLRRLDAGAGGDDVGRLQADAALGQMIGDPGQREARIAQRIGAGAFGENFAVLQGAHGLAADKPRYVGVRFRRKAGDTSNNTAWLLEIKVLKP